MLQNPFFAVPSTYKGVMYAHILRKALSCSTKTQARSVEGRGRTPLAVPTMQRKTTLKLSKFSLLPSE